MALEAVVPDLDGTLFDHPRAASAGLRAWLASLGLPCGPEVEAAWSAAEERLRRRRGRAGRGAGRRAAHRGPHQRPARAAERRGGGPGSDGTAGARRHRRGARRAEPRAAAFTAVCDLLGTAPERTLDVGDDHEADVLGARAAGLRAVHLDRTGTGPAGEAARLTSLLELGAHLALHAGTANPS